MDDKENLEKFPYSFLLSLSINILLCFFAAAALSLFRSYLLSSVVYRIEKILLFPLFKSLRLLPFFFFFKNEACFLLHVLH